MKKLRITIQGIIAFQLNLCMVIKLLTSIAAPFNNLIYITDAINVMLFCYAFKKCRRYRRELKAFIFLTGGLFAFDIIELFFRQQGIALFFWGARNQYRFLLFFFLFSVLCNIRDLYRLSCLIRKMLLANFIAVAVEFLLGYRQDLLSGLFGVTVGSNNGANLFLCIASASILIDYLCKRIALKYFVWYMAGILFWAAAAELKYFFIEAAVIFFVSLIIKKDSRRKIVVIAVGIVGGIFGIWMLSYLNPYFKDFFNINSIVAYANGIGIGVGGYKRLNAIPMTDQFIFGNANWAKAFGLGLGSAEQSSIAIFNSPIYKRFYAFNYTALFYGFLYIERGWAGLLWYAGFFLTSFAVSVKELKRTAEQNKDFLYKTIVIVVICFLQAIYDDALRRTPAGFLLYAFLAFPFIIRKENLALSVKGGEINDT